MKKYEYIETIDRNWNIYNHEHPKNQLTFEKYMNMLGQQGWEIFPGGMARREIEPEITVKKSVEIER